MARSSVYRTFEVREGFGPSDHGRLLFASRCRGDADRALEQISARGADVQLFGVSTETDYVLLRTLVGRRAA